MPIIQSDNTEITKLVEAMCHKIESHGGYVAPDMLIICEDNNLSISRPQPAHDGGMIKLPEACLVPYEAFIMGIEADDIVIHSRTEGATDLQADLLQDMLTLYNITGKIKSQRRFSPWYILREHPDLLEFLFSSREGTDIQQLQEAVNTNEIESARYETFSFFKGRLLGLKKDKDSLPVKVLMPIIDLVNHHTHGASFRWQGDEDGLVLAQANPVTGSNECFASYGKLDALDTYIHYGFIDREAPFVRSVPLDVSLGPAGTLKIGSFQQDFNGVMNPSIGGLRFYLPAMQIDHGARQVSVSHMFIPREGGIRSLQRILNYIITKIAPTQSEIERKTLILQAEAQIIAKNKDFYRRIIQNPALVDRSSNPALSMLHDLAVLQLERIALYQSTTCGRVLF